MEMKPIRISWFMSCQGWLNAAVAVQLVIWGQELEQEHRLRWLDSLILQEEKAGI